MGLLRQIFGPSKQEVWTSLAQQIGAEYVDGTFWKGAKVQAHHAQWTITLDTYTVSTGKSSVTYTRIRAPYVNPEGFRFSVRPHGMFIDLAILLGLRDVQVGYPDFDRDFVIRGSDDAKLRALFTDATLRQLLTEQPGIYFTVVDDEGYFGPTFPAGTDELRVVIVGVVKDLERLKLLFELFAETLDQLCRIGSAYEGAPDVTL